MVAFLFLLIALACGHFIYEGILAPSIRRRMRCELYIARDELRRLHREDAVPDDAYEIFSNGIEQFLHHLSTITLTSQIRFRNRYQADPKLRETVDERTATIKKCHTPELVALSKKLDRITNAALLVNTGMWFAYLVPIIVVMATFRAMKRWTLALFTVPAKNASEFLDDHCLA